MNAFNNLLKKVGVDKALHFLCGFVITTFGFPFGFKATSVAFLVSLFSAVAKEAYDYFDYGLFDVKDLVATMIGATAAFVYAYVSFFSQINIYFP